MLSVTKDEKKTINVFNHTQGVNRSQIDMGLVKKLTICIV